MPLASSTGGRSRIKQAIVFGRNPHQPDSFDLEADAAEALGIETYPLDLAALLEDDPERACANLPERGHLRLLYRGWMLTGEEYAALDEALGGARSGRDADHAHPVEPFFADLIGMIDQMGRAAGLARNFFVGKGIAVDGFLVEDVLDLYHGRGAEDRGPR